MATASAVVGAQIIGAHDLTTILSDEHLVARRAPIRESIDARDIARQRVGFAGPEDRLDHAPNGIIVGLHSRADGNGSTHCEMLAQRQLYCYFWNAVYPISHQGCPLWVISGHSALSYAYPLYPRKRTFVGG